MKVQEKVAVLGAGSWGTAWALLLADCGFSVNLWCHEQAVAQDIANNFLNNRYLPHFFIPEIVKPTIFFDVALNDVKWIFVTIPYKFLAENIHNAFIYKKPEHVWIIMCKGMHVSGLHVPTDMFKDEQRAVIMGPSFAQELAKKQPTIVTVASDQENIARELQKKIKNSYFAMHYSPDMIGVQIAGALKNVLALGIGMLDGAGYGDNIKAAFLTLGLREIDLIIRQKIVADNLLNYYPETVYGLSGLGDAVLTSFGLLSRNVSAGKMFGKAKTLQDIKHAIPVLPEGLNTLDSIDLAELSANTPILAMLYRIALCPHDRKTVKDLVAEIMKIS